MNIKGATSKNWLEKRNDLIQAWQTKTNKKKRRIILGLATKMKRWINQKEEMNITKDIKQELN